VDFSAICSKPLQVEAKKRSRTKSRTNAIWPELIGLEVHQRRIRALRQRAKTGPDEIQFNSGKTSNPSRPVENIQATRRGARWSEGLLLLKPAHAPVYKKSGRPKRTATLVSRNCFRLLIS